jgi:hypothetical protein
MDVMTSSQLKQTKPEPRKQQKGKKAGKQLQDIGSGWYSASSRAVFKVKPPQDANSR